MKVSPQEKQEAITESQKENARRLEEFLLESWRHWEAVSADFLISEFGLSDSRTQEIAQDFNDQLADALERREDPLAWYAKKIQQGESHDLH